MRSNENKLGSAVEPYRKLETDSPWAVNDETGVPLWIGADRAMATRIDALVANLLADRFLAKWNLPPRTQARAIAARAMINLTPKEGEWVYPPLGVIKSARKARQEENQWTR